MNRNILCISVPSWKGDYASTIVELMKILGKHNKVLYVQNPYTIKDMLSALVKRKKFPFRRVLGLSPRLQEYRTGSNGRIHVMVPPLILPINFLPQGFLYNTLLRFNGWVVQQSVSHWLKKLDMEVNLINIVSFNPVLGVVLGRQFKEKLLLYHCYDEIKEAVWMKKHGPAYEKKFMKMADAVVVTSQGLLETKRSFCQYCFLVKNAADIKLFSTAFTHSVPDQQRVGFIGSLDNRLDYDLLVFLIQTMPDTHFQFVGRIVDKKGETRLRAFKNVSLEGSKSLEELPGYVRNFSAGIIPFVKNDFTRGIYPLKVNEYLAAGLPVITTDFSYLDDFKAVVRIATDKEEFKQLLLQEMESDNLEQRLKRQEATAQNTWEKRVEDLSLIIQNLENHYLNSDKKPVYEFG